MPGAGRPNRSPATTRRAPKPRLPAVDPDEVPRSARPHVHRHRSGGREGVVLQAGRSRHCGRRGSRSRSTISSPRSTSSAEGDLPGWTLPEGWEQQEGEGMRAATITIPHDDSTLELAVSTLPLGDDWRRFLQQNVDRWMDQLDQESAEPGDDREARSKRCRPRRGDATLLELVGVMQRDAMAGGGMPAGHPPVDSAAPRGASRRGAGRGRSSVVKRLCLRDAARLAARNDGRDGHAPGGGVRHPCAKADRRSSPSPSSRPPAPWRNSNPMCYAGPARSASPISRPTTSATPPSESRSPASPHYSSSSSPRREPPSRRPSSPSMAVRGDRCGS